MHELGHFLAAKASGVTVKEFTVGFGPALFKKQVGETLYAVRLVPFGGATIMEGEDEDNNAPGSFQSASVIRRIAIVMAGSIMNLLLGFVILCVLFAPVKQVVEPRISTLMDGFPFVGEQGFMPGDEILSVNGTKVRLYQDLFVALEQGEGKPFSFTLKRGDQTVVLEDLALQKAEYTTNGETGDYYGFVFSTRQATWLDRVRLSFYNGVDFVRMVFDGLKMLVSGQAGVDDMSGPVAITTTISETAAQSATQAWYLLAFISVNLGVMNLLPLPALDGGRMIFLLYELIRGKPVNPKYEGYVHGAGFVLLLALLVFVTFNDIVRLVQSRLVG